MLTWFHVYINKIWNAKLSECLSSVSRLEAAYPEDFRRLQNIQAISVLLLSTAFIRVKRSARTRNGKDTLRRSSERSAS